MNHDRPRKLWGPLQPIVMRRYPRICGPAALPLFCLAPHGVFPASQITSRAVSSYLAFSTLPALRCQRTGGVFSATLSVAAVLQPRRPRVLRGMLPYGVRTFLQQAFRLTSDRLPSLVVYHNLETTKPGIEPRISQMKPDQGRARDILLRSICRMLMACHPESASGG